MAEWLYEAGIGENRAILVEEDEILEARIELPDDVRPGAVAAGRLTDILVPGRRGIVETADGAVLVEPLPGSLTQGQAVRVEIVRAPIPEPGRPKLARGAVTSEPEREGPSLLDDLGGGAVVLGGSDPADRFEAAGWSELLEEAWSGEIAFAGGQLRMSLTPAMVLFDVDGGLAPADLAERGAAAAGRAVRRLDIGGSIGIDLPTLASKAERQRAAAALDAVLPQPFERTAVNGFGFLQIVRRRRRPSLPELLQGDPIGAATRALLRRAERATGAGARTLVAAPAVIAMIDRNPQWREALARRVGTPIALRDDPALAISAGHVQSAFP